MITLRTYQTEAVNAVLAAWEQGRHAQLVVMSTGTGKSEVAFGILAEEYRTRALQRALLIVHTNELVRQPVERIQRDWQSLPTPGVVKAEQDEYAAQIVVATIQTLWSQGTMARLQRVIDAGLITHLWVDETHRVEAETYQAAIAKLKEANPFLRILGTTATPVRSDGAGLGNTFDDVAYTINIKQAIHELKAITDFQAFAVEVSADISGIRQNSDGDYQAGKLGDALSAHECHDAIIAKWKEVAAVGESYRPTIAFTASVAQAYSLSAAFNEAGVVAEALDGTSSADRRAEVVEAFRTGVPWRNGRPTEVVVNCAVFIEGFDAPRASCVIVDRPTGADLTYIQMVGRGLRWHDRSERWADDLGSQDAIILDVVPKGGRNLRLAGDLLGEPKAIRDAKTRATEQGMINDDLFAVEQLAFGADSMVRPDQTYLRVLDLFGSAPLAWFYGAGFASCSLGKKESDGINRALVVLLGDDKRIAKANELRDSGRWSEKWDDAFNAVKYRVFRLDWISDKNVTIYQIGAYTTFDAASDAASMEADQLRVPTLSEKTKLWRDKNVSAKQINYMIRLGLQKEKVSRCSRGEASVFITHAICKRALEGVGLIG